MKIMTPQLKSADLLFVKTRLNDEDEFAAAISESTGAYSHVAIATSGTTVIHATPKDGVIEETLVAFLSNHPQVDCFRVADIVAPDVLLEARKHLGKPYNHSFYPDGDAFYCSQLVITAFANQVKLPETAMTFGDGEKLISDYWQAYFDQLGVAVPLGQLGSNPDQIARFSALEYIGTLTDAN
ncbi:UDP-N-acetylmuramoylalanyl-D-glutamate--2, 6-diaminopimelate ligase [Bacilli bacterium]|nr:UDP-N-acetylmuramoylalanyl-D-glutamate--2, 6-diaminopimelate ligase [Bacilli bacterium]